jgi:hypothetical protein
MILFHRSLTSMETPRYANANANDALMCLQTLPHAIPRLSLFRSPYSLLLVAIPATSHVRRPQPC